MKKTLGKRAFGFCFAMVVALTVFTGSSVKALAYTQTTGTVISDNVKVRESASTTATQVSSLRNGDTVDIVDEATDASGYVWYKIYVNKNEFGYVRSDLVNKKGGSSTATSTSTASAASLPETAVTATEQRNATVLSDSVNVRKGAGTAYDSVGKVSKGDTVVITGEASGTDNKTWFQVSFGDGKSGFVRSDLVAVSDTPVEATENTEGAEGENAEGAVEGENAEGQPAEEQTQTPDTTTGDGAYSLYYTTDEEGSGVWYLYDNFGGYRVKVKELIETASSAEQVNTLRKTSNNLKKIALALAILAVVLIAGIIILALKLRDSLYYEDEEEEEYDRYSPRKKNADDDYAPRRAARDENPRSPRSSDTVRPERNERPSRRDAENERPSRREADSDRPVRRSADERTVRPQRRNADEEVQRPVRRAERPARDNEIFEDEHQAKSPLRDAEERQARRQEVRRDEEQAAPKRKARNFVGDDDDFEFEFLDLDE